MWVAYLISYGEWQHDDDDGQVMPFVSYTTAAPFPGIPPPAV